VVAEQGESKWSERPTRMAIWLMSGTGMLLLLSGIVVYFVSDRDSASPERQQYLCAENNEAEAVTPVLWLLWIMICVLAVAVGTLRRNSLKGDETMKTLSTLGALAAVFTCPVWLIAATVFNCGM